jgi:hypothetical protein
MSDQKKIDAIVALIDKRIAKLQDEQDEAKRKLDLDYQIEACFRRQEAVLIRQEIVLLR